jgi:TRAP transporter 4TM/12TM fusion protein
MEHKYEIKFQQDVPIADGENITLKRNFLPRTPWMYFIYTITSIMVIFHIYILAFSPVDPWIFSMGHLQFGIILGFLYYAARSKSACKVTYIDILFILASIASYAYLLWDFDNLVQRAGVLPEGYDIIFGLFALVSVIELTRRTAGWALTVLIAVFISYCFAGPYLPGIFWHKGYSLERVISFMFSQNGIYNVPLGVTARFVYLFVLFGAFLELSGAAKFFMNFSYAIAGKTRGGPAKVAIFSSGLLGMVNGTSTGNVVTTGSMTIPLMKRTGYDPYFAGAVEATASTGGQIMPPVMGAAVFLMAQMMNQDYSSIMISATIPALLYYIALYFSVDLEAGRLKLIGIDKKNLPSWRNVASQSYLAFPLIILMYFLLAENSSVVFAGIMGLLGAVSVGMIHRFVTTGRIFELEEFMNAVRDGGVNVVQITATCAAAGIIIGSLTLTGLGLKIATIVVNVSGGNLLICLILTMVVTIILGMGLPTIAAYAIPASVIVPALVEMGVGLLPAHLFVLYFASLSAITPPVALASYAAAAIAGVNPFKLSVFGLKIGLAGFIIPFMFVYGPQLLLFGSISSILLSAITAIIGVFSLSICVIGYFKTKISIYFRLLFLLASLVLIKPGLITDSIGLFLLAFLIIWQVNLSKTKDSLSAA